MIFEKKNFLEKFFEKNFNSGFDLVQQHRKNMKKRWDLKPMVDLEQSRFTQKEREMQGARLNSGFDLQSNKEYCEAKKMGFDYTMEQKELLKKKMGYIYNGGIDLIQEQKEF